MTFPSPPSQETQKIPSFEDVLADFALFADWEERYSYIIELGSFLPPLPRALQTRENLVVGCASQVWLDARAHRLPDGALSLVLRADSDALIVRGLVYLVLTLFSGRTLEEMIALDADACFARLGLVAHLTRQRANGLAAMVAKIKSLAHKFLAHPPSDIPAGDSGAPRAG